MLLDTSHTAEGYVAAAATSDARLKFRVNMGSKYNYDRPTEPRRSTRYSWATGNTPLKCGGKNPNGKYARLYGPTETVALASEFEPLCAPASW